MSKEKTNNPGPQYFAALYDRKTFLKRLYLTTLKRIYFKKITIQPNYILKYSF